MIPMVQTNIPLHLSPQNSMHQANALHISFVIYLNINRIQHMEQTQALHRLWQLIYLSTSKLLQKLNH